MINDVLLLFLTRPEFFAELAVEHLHICGIAVAFSCSLGLCLGLVAGEYEKIGRFVIGGSSILYTIPAISLFGFLLPFTGIGNGTAIIALALYGLLPMIANTCSGIKNIDPDIVEAARGMGSTDAQLLFKIKIPMALPVIVSGMRTMVVMTIALAGIASFIGAGGLGVAIYRGISTNNMSMTMAGSLLIALIALVADAFFLILEKNIPWKKRGKRHG